MAILWPKPINMANNEFFLFALSIYTHITRDFALRMSIVWDKWQINKSFCYFKKNQIPKDRLWLYEFVRHCFCRRNDISSKNCWALIIVIILPFLYVHSNHAQISVVSFFCALFAKSHHSVSHLNKNSVFMFIRSRPCLQSTAQSNCFWTANRLETNNNSA